MSCALVFPFVCSLVVTMVQGTASTVPSLPMVHSTLICKTEHTLSFHIYLTRCLFITIKVTKPMSQLS